MAKNTNIDWNKLRQEVKDIEENNLLNKEDDTSFNFFDYAQMHRLKQYAIHINSMNYSTTEVKDLVKSINSFLRLSNKQRYNAFHGDLLELDKCFNAKAYKATLILAGSILEAFLIDWLSEIDGIDYFENPYIKNGKQKDTLYEYIKSIEEINHPDWMKESEKALVIKDKRNLVHAKLCLNSNVSIDEKICREVITYLKEIIDARLGSNTGN